MGITLSYLRVYSVFSTKLAGLAGFNLLILSTNYVHWEVDKIAG